MDIRAYIGETGTGKSYRCFKEAAEYGLYYVKTAQDKWWDGYKGEENVIIDEFGDKCIDIKYLLSWLQNYPCQVHIKNGKRVLKAKRFWITSNQTMREWFPEAGHKHMAALINRFNVIEEMNTPWVAPVEHDQEIIDIVSGLFE